MSERVRVVVVGAGISGLATAHALLTKHGERVTVTVLESEDRVGGNVRTVHKGPFLIDEGPDSWVANKPHVTALARALGLGDRLIETVPANRRVYVKSERGLVPLPEGLMLGIPTRILPLVRTPLLSWRGKLRAGLDLVLPVGFARAGGEDEPLGAYIERRLGREVLEKLAGPLLGGLFTGDVSALSLLGTFPQLAALEKQGGLIRGSLAMARKAPKRTGPAPSAFLSLRGGVGELIETLEARLGDAIVRGARVTATKRDADGTWVVEHARGRVVADHVVITGPTHVAAALVRPSSAELAHELEGIPYGSAATVFLGYPRAAIPHALDATGYLVPKKEPGGPLAATWVSSKWPHRAPEGDVLMRIFFGAADVDRSDDDLVSMARAEVASTLGVASEPTTTHVARFRRTSPQPRVGHPARLRRIAEHLEGIPGLYLAGSAYDGVGLGDCVRQAETIAERIAGSA